EPLPYRLCAVPSQDCCMIRGSLVFKPTHYSRTINIVFFLFLIWALKVGLCTSSWERLETCLAGLTQRRIGIAGRSYTWRMRGEKGSRKGRVRTSGTLASG